MRRPAVLAMTAAAPVLALLGCSNEEPTAPETTVSVCIGGDGAADVELLQDGERVGLVTLGDGGTAGFPAPRGDYEVRVDDEFFGEASTTGGGSVTLRDAACAAEQGSSTPTPTSSPGP